MQTLALIGHFLGWSMTRLSRALLMAGTIRVRLTLWYVALLAAMLFGFSAFLYVNLARNLTDELDTTLQDEAQEELSSLDVSRDRPRLNDKPDHHPTGTLIAVYDLVDNRPIAGETSHPALASARPDPATLPERRTYSTVTTENGDSWRLITIPVFKNGRPFAALQVARSLAEIQAPLRHVLFLISLAMPLSLLVAVAAGLFLASRALGPIDRITRAAEQISAENLSRRLDFKGRDDEVGRLAATFDHMLTRLDGSFARQRQFVADASHELRTPLAMLTSQVDVALARTRSPEEYRDVLRSVRQDATRLNQLLGEMLTLARGDAGQEMLLRESLDLSDLVQDVLIAMSPLAETREVSLRRGSTRTAMVEGDQTRLTQLLINLVDNGIKYTPPGGTVTVGIGHDQRAVVLTVSDTGVGIEAKDLPHVFERFYRVDAAHSHTEGGAGLGLPICQWIVQAHGGEISVASQPGQGTTFTVRLPRAVAEAQAANPTHVPTAGRA